MLHTSYLIMKYKTGLFNLAEELRRILLKILEEDHGMGGPNN